MPKCPAAKDKSYQIASYILGIFSESVTGYGISGEVQGSQILTNQKRENRGKQCFFASEKAVGPFLKNTVAHAGADITRREDWLTDLVTRTSRNC